MPHDQLFSDFLEQVGEKMPMISKRPFVNINGKTFYNPSDSARRVEKENFNLG